MRPGSTLVLSLLLVAAGCRSRTKTDPALARLQKRVGDFDRRLAAIRRAVPDAAHVQDQACPDAAIDKQLHGSTASVLLVDYADLARYGSDKAAAGSGKWKTLTTPVLRDLPLARQLQGKTQATDTLWKIQKLQRSHPYLAVLRSARRDLPRMDGQRFHAGVLQGGLFVFDLASGKLLCRASVDAHSSREVAATKGQGAAQALSNDFSLQLRHALDQALSRVSHQLELDFDQRNP